MTPQLSNKSVHLMRWRDRRQLLRDMRRAEGRNIAELALYTTDNLRCLYQSTADNTIKLRDGVVTRHQLVAVILQRIFWARLSYCLLLIVSIIAAIAAVVAAIEGWKP